MKTRLTACSDTLLAGHSTGSNRALRRRECLDLEHATAGNRHHVSAPPGRGGASSPSCTAVVGGLAHRAGQVAQRRDAGPAAPGVAAGPAERVAVPPRQMPCAPMARLIPKAAWGKTMRSRLVAPWRTAPSPVAPQRYAMGSDTPWTGTLGRSALPWSGMMFLIRYDSVGDCAPPCVSISLTLRGDVSFDTYH